MLKQQAKEKWRFNLMPFRLSAARAMQLPALFKNHLLDASLRPRAAPRSRRATWQERDDPCRFGKAEIEIGQRAADRDVTDVKRSGRQRVGLALEIVGHGRASRSAALFKWIPEGCSRSPSLRASTNRSR